MQKNLFSTVVFILALIIAFAIWWFILGDPANFKDGEGRHQPINLLGTIFVGGYFVPVLIMLSILVITFVFERIFSLGKAKGKGNMATFIRDIQRHLDSGKIDEAIKTCDRQRGSLANIVKTGLERYQAIAREGKGWEAEKQMAEVQRSIEEATSLELPVLERNLIVLSTIASIATMVGLLGTTVGMIRAFRALAHAGAPDAIQLSIGISEALVNTAFGLFAAITGIVAYNFFVNKVDTFTYMIDEAGYNIVQTLMTKSK
ncbi:MAG: MotA/TolQ/ExbB proton channel family protein [Ignavibacteriae bacterium]|nr:MAG: MotA/TolQ/ExbB proton channel family protein [Ignavibacteriota bacterium]